MPAKISGEGFASIHLNAQIRHDKAWDEAAGALPIGGLYRYRAGAEAHAYQANLIHLLQEAVARDSYSDYLRFSRATAELPPIYLRDLLEFNWAKAPLPTEAVESITEIRKRFVTPGMSLGRARTGGARDPGDRDEPHRRQGGQRRGRRGCRALQAARQRRQRQLRGQADRQRALRGHRRVSERLRGDRDQGRARCQARRGRPAARLQGYRADRPACATRRRAWA